VSGPEQQHRFGLQVLAGNRLALGPRVMPRYRNGERLVVDRLHLHAGLRQRQRHDRDIDFAIFQQFEQLDREILGQQQRHLRCILQQLSHQPRQQVRDRSYK
jgi:hypothetical protein